jgi:hypothetical protein
MPLSDEQIYGVPDPDSDPPAAGSGADRPRVVTCRACGLRNTVVRGVFIRCAACGDLLPAAIPTADDVQR